MDKKRKPRKGMKSLADVEPEKIIELNVRERQLIRALLINEALKCERLSQEVELPAISAGIQETGQMANEIMDKLFEPIDDFIGVWKVRLTHWKEK